MPANKDFKRLIRGRMRKTGESYTAARAHLLAHRPSRTTRSTAADFATLAGRSDAALKAATGCTWERWVRALDHVEAHTWTHRDIAKYVAEKYKVAGWWAQTVTLGYERIKGLRAVGQRRDGSFEASKSRTFAVPLTRLYRAAERRPRRSYRDPPQVDADHLARSFVGERRVRQPRTGEEPGRGAAREAARPRGRRAPQAVLDRAPRRPRKGAGRYGEAGRPITMTGSPSHR